MIIDLPFPDKILWPNGPQAKNHGHRNAVVQKHREWAQWAAIEALGSNDAFAPRQIVLHVHAKPKGPLPDKDNCIAAYKAFQDGIADALAINDGTFPAPSVEFSKPRDGRFVVELLP